MLQENILLDVNMLKKHFFTKAGTVRAIDGISFSVEKGETFGIVGESGSGKSTVIYSTIGMYKPTDGKITYKGMDISRQGFKERSKSVKKEMQIVFQDPASSLNPAMDISQILSLPLKVFNLTKGIKDHNKKIRDILELVELPASYMRKYPSQIGSGERQMVAIARSLVLNPELIFLDEPTSALDVSIQAKIFNKLMQFQKDFKLTYVFVTHDLSLMRNVASRVAIMYLGKICEIGYTNDFFKNPLHPYTQMLLSSIPVITKEEEALKPKDVVSKGEIASPINVPKGCSFFPRCPHKKDICSIKEPIMIELKKKHFVKCHLYMK